MLWVLGMNTHPSVDHGAPLTCKLSQKVQLRSQARRRLASSAFASIFLLWALPWLDVNKV